MAKKKDKQTHKTNAVRIVEAEGVPYNMYTYDAPDGFLDGVSVAKTLGQDLDRVFKTLVTVGASRAIMFASSRSRGAGSQKSGEAFR